MANKYTWKGSKSKHSISEAQHQKNVKSGATSSGGSRVTPADYVRLGPEAADIKSRTSPGRWHQIVKTAHDQGWTVQSALDSNTPAALKQNTKSSLMKAAKRTVDTSFNPQVAELDAADASNAGLRQKRLSDQSAYDQWSAQKSSELAGSVNAAQQKYLDTIKGSTDSQIADSQARQAALVAKTGTGVSGDMSGAAPIVNAGQAAGAEQERARATLTTAAAQTPIVATRAAAIQLSDLGSGQARHAQIEGEYGKQASDIFKGRLKLNSDRAAAQVQEYSDLLKTEMDKASANRDSSALRDQLQSKADIAKMQHQEFLVGNKTKVRGQNVAAATTKRGQTLSHGDRQAQIRSSETTAALDRAARLQAAALRATAADKSKANGPAAQKASKAQVQSINSLADMIRRGVVVGPDGKRHKATRSQLMAMGATKGQIDVAVRISQGRKHVLYDPAALGILPGDAARLG